jgi:hypothetical protein
MEFFRLQTEGVRVSYMPMEWETILSDAVQNGKIRELHLSKIPVLKTTTNWKRVELLGWVDHQLKYTHYRGALVKLNDKLFFVKENTVQALQQYVNWKTKNMIQVIKD